MKKNKNIDKETRLKNIENAVREILINIGEDVDREGLVETPKRVAKMYEEILSTKSVDDFENYKLFDVDLGDSQEMVLVKEIPFFSMCEHHMLPFFGKVHVAYIPRDNKVIGLSKIPRLVEFISKKLIEENQKQQANKKNELLRIQEVQIFVAEQNVAVKRNDIFSKMAKNHQKLRELLGNVQEEFSNSKIDFKQRLLANEMYLDEKQSELEEMQSALNDLL